MGNDNSLGRRQIGRSPRVKSVPEGRHFRIQFEFQDQRLHIPFGLADMSPADAALAYAEAGWCVLPTKRGAVKNPGSLVGKRHQYQATNDPAVIRGWFDQWPNAAGIALHAGRSGAIAFDLDVDSLNDVPQRLRDALRLGRFQSTRQSGDRGHYVFALAAGEQFGNGAGAFAPFGEVRCAGVFVAEPTPHPDAATKNGRYHWPAPGALPPLPDALRECLRSAGEEAPVISPAELEAFYAAHTASNRPKALDGVIRTFETALAGGMARHDAARNALAMAFREAAAGCYPAREAADRIEEVFVSAFTPGGPGRVRPAPGEFLRTACWAAAQASVVDPAETLARLDRYVADEDSEVQKEAAKLRIRDRAKALYAEEKARQQLTQHRDRLMDGLAFLTEDADAEPLWGQGGQVLWASGEGLMICGPQGVGKSTIVQQLMLARMGLRPPELCGLPVLVDERPILYLAMDRPPQIRRSLNRMIDTTDETVAAALKRQLVIWKGPPPFDAAEAPGVFADWVALHGREPGLVIVDSLKDLASGLAKDEVGAGVNLAMQLVLANGTEFIDLHHQRKANADNKKPDKLSDVYGNGWLTAGMGSVVLAWGDPGASTVELSHLKQPQEKVGPLMVNHSHGTGSSTAADPLEKLTELATAAGGLGITEAEAVRCLYDVGRDDDTYDTLKKQARRRLDRLREDGVLDYEAGARGGAGGGGKPARWRVRG
ncbi:bifunctional DNA primase/polymerase [Nocardia cyriacigeorgica]|uniref:bifunctional DNA primase/polymerase n=1 Tax=Nocardia cyriacigeorgica TaxID=135487 RepID=UPI001894C2B5|nr:bifunctional DNA primase/polymerase [Nocardia cyriacigeorgica]MBF6161355.1 bifunctional DNA primase/polymerase [Nocardia cyriacigeorgica]MBF6200220.1 bifunctional DNA primase/polymerase [Nocardia cyriacigeorgica]MBF6395095.1 bifunctional DNA primase/polymerase [Nocardia cyriacigeorgica]MBF6400728.1 bifunctional DNA primase/polymerase [Nocardia cyriacigeorgica]